MINYRYDLSETATVAAAYKSQDASAVAAPAVAVELLWDDVRDGAAKWFAHGREGDGGGDGDVEQSSGGNGEEDHQEDKEKWGPSETREEVALMRSLVPLLRLPLLARTVRGVGSPLALQNDDVSGPGSAFIFFVCAGALDVRWDDGRRRVATAGNVLGVDTAVEELVAQGIIGAAPGKGARSSAAAGSGATRRRKRPRRWSAVCTRAEGNGGGGSSSDGDGDGDDDEEQEAHVLVILRGHLEELVLGQQKSVDTLGGGLAGLLEHVRRRVEADLYPSRM